MSKIMIMTDSGCDLTKEIITELGITVIPFEITLGGKSFREIFDKSTEEFYEMLSKTDEIPKHSQISPIVFAEHYEKLYKDGYTDIICVSINSEGSGTYNNSLIAKEEFFADNPEAVGKVNIYNIDSRSYSIFYGYPIIEAVKKLRKGAEAEDIVAYFEEWFRVCAMYAVPLTLKYARRSGRISAAKAFAGELLGMKPIIEFADNTTETVDKIRGEKNVVTKLVECVEKRMTPQTPYIMICGNDDTLAKEVEKELHKRTGRKAEMTAHIGGVVTSNIGPDLVAVLIRRKNKS